MTQAELSSQANPVLIEKVQFPATDGYVLSGTRYVAINIDGSRLSTPAKAKLLIASATGVPQAFYRRFASYMTRFGFEVFSFDYRGIADSAPKKLKGFKMSYLDWGQYDLSGAIAYLSQDDVALIMIGHSYGGQSLGLSTNHQRVRAMFCFGTGAGWAGYMPPKERFKVHIVWNVVFPPLVALKGYLPWSKFNMGADLPKGVYSEWRRWCKNPNYFFADPEQGDMLKTKFAQVSTEIYAYSALDDDWALPNSRYAFIQHYSQAKVHYINIKAQDFAMQQIGHMGYFKKEAQLLWDHLAAQIDQLLCADPPQSSAN